MILGILFCLLATGFFSGVEMGLISINKFKLRHQIEEKNKKASIIGRLLDKPEIILSTALVGTNVFIVTASILADKFLINFFPTHSDLISVISMTFLILLFGEIIPKSLFRQHADKIILPAAYLLEVINYIFYPTTKLILIFVNTVSKLANKDPHQAKKPFISKEDLKFLAKNSIAKESIDGDRDKMIERALNFNKITIEEVMVSLDDAIMLDIDSPIEEALQLTIKHHYSRIPVYDKKREKVKGLVNIYDIIFDKEPKDSLKDYLRHPYHLYKNDKISRALSLLKDNRRPLALVIDNDNECHGIITLEDVIRKIVGEIEA